MHFAMEHSGIDECGHSVRDEKSGHKLPVGTTADHRNSDSVVRHWKNVLKLVSS